VTAVSLGHFSWSSRMWWSMPSVFRCGFSLEFTMPGERRENKVNLQTCEAGPRLTWPSRDTYLSHGTQYVAQNGRCTNAW
jgi:hypothetical protein